MTFIARVSLDELYFRCSAATVAGATAVGRSRRSRALMPEFESRFFNYQLCNLGDVA